MYTPYLRVKNNGVPILSKAEIDAIGERFVQDFQPEVLTNPSPVDIEGFIEFYLGMTPDYQYPVSYTHLDVYKRQLCDPKTRTRPGSCRGGRKLYCN